MNLDDLENLIKVYLDGIKDTVPAIEWKKYPIAYAHYNFETVEDLLKHNRKIKEDNYSLLKPVIQIFNQIEPEDIISFARKSTRNRRGFLASTGKIKPELLSQIRELISKEIND